MSIPRLHSWVDGAPLATAGGETFDAINPATGATVYRVEQADAEVVEAAVAAAQRGFLRWSAMSAVERARILQRAAQGLRDENDALARLEVIDTGKPWQEASTVDVATGADVIEFFAGEAPGLEGNCQQLGRDFYYTRREPLGICAGIGAWNYPLQIACWKAGPALACGNSLIFKPSEETPRGALELARILRDAGLPDGVFNVVQGDARVGRMLTAHPAIAKVSFTGEAGTGRAVMADSARTLKAVTMELGGKSPLLVFADADLDDAVTAALLGNFYTQGEVCTHGTRVFVQRGLYQAFLDRLLVRLRQNVVVGDPLDVRTNFGALISAAHLAKVLDYVAIGRAEGARCVIGGERLHPVGCEDGFFISPTVFVDCHDGMRIVREEIFGPVMCLLVFDDEDEAISRANASEYGLAGAVFTRDVQRAHRVAHRLQAGICWINAYGNSPAEMPVGGYKQSGLGRENGRLTLQHYTQVKSVYVGMGHVEGPF